MYACNKAAPAFEHEKSVCAVRIIVIIIIRIKYQSALG